MSADVTVALVFVNGRVTARYAEGCTSPAGMIEAVNALCPELLYALAPALPPRDQWPPDWIELYEERAAICADGGAPDPEAIADAALRLAVWRREV